jgi:hypothetical protein
MRDESYDQAVAALMAERVVREMAAGLLNPDAELRHEDGTPTFQFMQNARAEYEFRTGHAAAGHIGAVAEALLAIRDEGEEWEPGGGELEPEEHAPDECGADLTVGPAHDPYGTSCDQPPGHYPATDHAGPHPMGTQAGDRVTWRGGGTCAGDRLAHEITGQQWAR